MLPNRPDISCIIPTYNDRNNLNAAVYSVLEQEGVNVEVVLIDDCSDAPTREYIASLARQDARIRTVMLSENGGQSVARNIGGMVATAPLLAFLDQDDRHCQGWYAFALGAFRDNPDMASLSGEAQVVGLPERLGIDATDLRIRGLSAVFITNLMCRRSAFLASGGFPRDPIWRSPIAGEDGVFRVALHRHWLAKSCGVPALIHTAREGGATVTFLDRSRVENGQVHIEATPLEASGELQAATDAYLLQASETFIELQRSQQPDSVQL